MAEPSNKTQRQDWIDLPEEITASILSLEEVLKCFARIRASRRRCCCGRWAGGVKFWDPPGKFTLVYEYQLKCGLMFPLPPFVQYTLACLHVAPGQVTPNMLKQILGTSVLFRLLKQEFPNCDEFNALFLHVTSRAGKWSRGGTK
ncbi:hypothetical protein ACLB2K_070871 [Fragaria x ananassa]